MRFKSELKYLYSLCTFNFARFLLGLEKRFNSFSIISFHRIVAQIDLLSSPNKSMMISQQNFEKFLEFIKNYCYPLSLREALIYSKNQKNFPPYTVVLTFDDGYIDNYTIAFPLLKRYQIPATFFLTTSYISNPENYLWWDQVEYYFKKQYLSPLSITSHLSDELKSILNRINTAGKINPNINIRELIQTLKRGSSEQRELFMTHINEKVKLDNNKPVLMMNWEMVKEMAHSPLFDFGAHTENHVYLDEISKDEIEREIILSKKKIEKVTGQDCMLFAYPAGRKSVQAEQILKDSGINAALTTEFGTNTFKSDFLRLFRKDSGYLLLDNRIKKIHTKAVLLGLYDHIYG